MKMSINYFLSLCYLLCLHVFTVRAEGTINPAGNAAADADSIHKCPKTETGNLCIPCVLDVIAARPLNTRIAIKSEYQKKFKEDLSSLIAYTDVNAAAYSTSLIRTPAEIFCEILTNAKNDKGILEVLFSASRDDKMAILAKLNGVRPKLNNVSEDVDNVVNEMWDRNRAIVPNTDPKFVQDRIDELCDKSDDWDDDRETLDSVMMDLELGQSKIILDTFTCDGNNFLVTLKDNMEEDKKIVYNALALYIMDRPTYYAELLNYALNIQDFSENWLIVEVIVLHYQLDLVEIKERYNEIYKIKVTEEIKQVSEGELYTITSYLLGDKLETDTCSPVPSG